MNANLVNLNQTVPMGIMGYAEQTPLFELFIERSDDLHEVMTEDGMDTDVNACVALRRIDGKVWHHYRLFTGGFQMVGDDECGYHDIYRSAATQAYDLLEKMQAAGTIDMKYWDAAN